MDIQPNIVKLLKNSFYHKRLSHAYLFYGEKGTGKMEIANYFAKMLYCLSEDFPCDTCNNCLRIEHKTHPNIYHIEPINTTIKKEQVTAVLAEAAKTSVEVGPKVFIISEADKLNQASANSLLKFIEEPLDDIYIILLSENKNAILPTILSRVQLVYFPSLSTDIIKKELVLEGYDELIVNVLPEYTKNVEEIKSIAADDNMYKIISLITELFNLNFKKESLITYFNSYYDLIKKDRYKTDFFISLILLYLKDIYDCGLYQKQDFVFSISKNRIIELSKMISNDKLLKLINKTLEIKNRIRFNVSDKLLIDNLLYKIETVVD